MENLIKLRDALIKLELTLLPPKVLDNIEFCIRNVVQDGIDGDFIETGVWRGGAVIYAYHILKSLGSNKKVYVADSFEGLPAPDTSNYPMDAGDHHWTLDWLKVDLETVKENFNLFGGYDDNVIFVKGWFKDTLPRIGIEKLSVLRLDGDMYESTMDSLNNLYDKLSSGGYCIIDDFGHVRCIQAVLDFRQARGITEEMIIIDTAPGAYPSMYWRKDA